MPVHRFRGFSTPAAAVVCVESSQFVTKISANRVCQLCHCVPHQIRTQSCGHGLCEDCWEQIVSLTNSDPKVCFETDCPKKVLYQEAKKTAFPEEALLNLELKCDNHGMGCDVTGKFLEVLTIHEPYCKFRKIICRKCRSPVQHRNYLLHISQCGNSQEQQQTTSREELAREIARLQQSAGSRGCRQQ